MTEAKEQLSKAIRALEACKTVLNQVPLKYQGKEYKYALQIAEKTLNDYYISLQEGG